MLLANVKKIMMLGLACKPVCNILDDYLLTVSDAYANHATFETPAPSMALDNQGDP